MEIRDYLLMKRINKEPGISLENLIVAYGSSIESRLKGLESQKLVKHTERTYIDSAFFLDTIGEGNNRFILTDSGIVALENKKDRFVQKFIYSCIGYVLGFLSALLTGLLVS